MATKSRLPLALEVFRTLQRYPTIQPRRVPEAPIGCRLYQPKVPHETPSISEPADVETIKYGELTEDDAPAAAAESPSSRRRISQTTAQSCLQHLYHDLGVLVFAGCTANQTRRIGDILSLVARQGGIGGVVAGLTPERKAKKHREERLPASALNNPLSARWDGSIKPEALLQRASAQLRKTMADELVVSDLQPSEYELRETKLSIPGFPLPRGLNLPTVSGPRQLSVDSYTSIRAHRISGHVKGEVTFYTAGVGDLVGTVQISYAILRLGQIGSRRRIMWAHNSEVSGIPPPNPTAQREARDAVEQGILEPLWQLEREIWEHRAVEMAKLRIEPFEGI